MATRTKIDELAELGVVPPVGQKLVELFGDADQTAIASLTPISTANATDEATAVNLVNECKAKINLIVAALKG